MKNFINYILAIVAPLTSAPTAWAIFAGITKDRTAIPMNDWVAGVGAVSILLVDIAAAILVTDAYYFQQSSENDDERSKTQPLWWSISILATAIASEIFLSLVIVIVEQTKEWGVIVFPFMTLAGAFAVAARIDLTYREQRRAKVRKAIEDKKQEALEKARQTRLAKKLKQEKVEQRKLELEEKQLAKQREKELAEQRKLEAKAEQEKARLLVKQAEEEAKLKELQCTICEAEGNFYQAESKKQLAGHMRAHPIAKREPEPLFWTCKACETVNKQEKKECRICGETR